MRTALLILALSALSSFGQAFSFNDHEAWLAQQKAASGGASWNPSNETSVIFWVQASNLTNANAGSVAFAIDSSGHNNNAVAPGNISGPTFYTGVINAKPALQWQSGNALDTPVDAATLPVTFAGVFEVTNAISSAPYCLMAGATNSPGLAIYVNTSGTLLLAKDGISNIGETPGGIQINSWYAYVVTYDGTSWAAYTNGIAMGSGTASVSGLVSGWSRLGVDFGVTPSFYFKGWIAEEIKANAVWNTTTINNFFTYARSKYAFW